MTTKLRPFFRHLTVFVAALFCAGLLQGCGSVVNLEGVYLPAWVICLLIGVSGSAFTLYRLQRTSLKDCLPNHGLCFVCFTCIYGVLTWLIFFRT